MSVELSEQHLRFQRHLTNSPPDFDCSKILSQALDQMPELYIKRVPNFISIKKKNKFRNETERSKNKEHKTVLNIVSGHCVVFWIYLFVCVVSFCNECVLWSTPEVMRGYHPHVFLSHFWLTSLRQGLFLNLRLLFSQLKPRKP